VTIPGASGHTFGARIPIKALNQRLTVRAHGSRDLLGSFMCKSRRWGMSGGFFVSPGAHLWISLIVAAELA
jgi:hypothetical protein